MHYISNREIKFWHLQNRQKKIPNQKLVRHVTKIRGNVYNWEVGSGGGSVQKRPPNLSESPTL